MVFERDGRAYMCKGFAKEDVQVISNQVLQTTLEGLKGISKVDLCVLDTDGIILATTFPEAEAYRDSVLGFADSAADSQVVSGCQFFKVFDDHQLEYILLATGNSDDVHMVGRMAAFQVQNLLVAYKERFDKDNFIKNLLLDNLLLVDIYNRAKKLHIDTEARRVVFTLEINSGRENSSLEIVRSLFSSRPGDFITAIDEKSVIVVRELSPQEGYPEMDKIAQTILDALGEEKKKEALIAYGTIVNEIKEVSRSYKEARMALNVGKIFFEERSIIAYSSLGIGRLIYQLPVPLCKMFIREIFDGKSPDDFDEETLITINKFFENNLNVSETSRQLYIHRNTLVYRLDKLQKSTGLDLRVFEDAITFKIALMVVKYMKYMEHQEY
jgi:carbohydrate diacid regulator